MTTITRERLADLIRGWPDMKPRTEEFRLLCVLALKGLEAEWRTDLENAPKDGTEIIGHRPDQGEFVFRWALMSDLIAVDQAGDSTNDYDEHEGWWHDRWGWMEGDLKPTHWMPLPKGPTPPGGEQS